jgi:cytochrome bd ubiquinol oxidase subunit II
MDYTTIYSATLFGLDYPTLWFLVVGGVFSGYAILDGFDLGAGSLHLFFKKEENRRIALNAVGPVWDGNEVWLVIGGGALFAGFPDLYATLFSGLYVPFMLFVALLIFRAVSIEFRSKEKMLWWRKLWDTTYMISSSGLSIALGAVLANVLEGMPINEAGDYVGNGWDFFSPYAIIIGLTTWALFMMHGAIYLALKTQGAMYEFVTLWVKRSIIFFILMFLIASAYTMLFVEHMVAPLKEHPVLLLLPLIALLSIANIPRLAEKRNFTLAFVFSTLTVSMLFILVAIGLFPTFLASTIDPAYDITVYTSAASEKTLGIMLLMASIGTPLVGLYTFIVYRSFRGKVKLDEHSY